VPDGLAHICAGTIAQQLAIRALAATSLTHLRAVAAVATPAAVVRVPVGRHTRAAIGETLTADACASNTSLLCLADIAACAAVGTVGEYINAAASAKGLA
jgi:hypothetical protein